MRTLAHIIHPCLPPPSSDLHIAQPITFATMQTARAFAEGRVDVQLYSVKQQDEAFDLPTGFTPTPELTRTLYELGQFSVKRKLALLKDILDRLYAAAPAAEYLIYTNVDIALQPHFYLVVDHWLDQGYDALIINRRTIAAHYQSVTEIPLMYAEVGAIHPGRDCFVFKRSAYPHYQLGQICIGANRIGAALALNLVYHATNFKELTDLHLTFHIGEERIWRTARYQDYALHNEREFQQIFQHYRMARPTFKHPLVERFAKEQLYVHNRQHPCRALAGRLLQRLQRYWPAKGVK